MEGIGFLRFLEHNSRLLSSAPQNKRGNMLRLWIPPFVQENRNTNTLLYSNSKRCSHIFCVCTRLTWIFYCTFLHDQYHRSQKPFAANRQAFHSRRLDYYNVHMAQSAKQLQNGVLRISRKGRFFKESSTQVVIHISPQHFIPA